MAFFKPERLTSGCRQNTRFQWLLGYANGETRVKFRSFTSYVYVYIYIYIYIAYSTIYRASDFKQRGLLCGLIETGSKQAYHAIALIYSSQPCDISTSEADQIESVHKPEVDNRKNC